jgi:hypothetical protein
MDRQIRQPSDAMRQFFGSTTPMTTPTILIDTIGVRAYASGDILTRVNLGSFIMRKSFLWVALAFIAAFVGTCLLM